MSDENNLIGGIDLYNASANNDLNKIRALYIQFGENLDLNCLIRHDHITPLCIAIYYRNIPCINQLLSYGANPNIGGVNALHYASFMGDIDMVKLLLEYGADPNILSFSGKSAIDLAKDHNQLDIVEFFEHPFVKSANKHYKK